MIDQHKSLAEKFIKKGFWLYLFSFIIAPIWYIIKIILSNELSVADIGILYGILSLVTILSVYNDMWMTESLKHFIPKYVTQNRYDRVKFITFFAFFIQIITSIFIAWIFFIWADYLAVNYFQDTRSAWVLKVFSFFFVWICIFQTLNNFFLAVQNTFLHKITEFLRMLFVMLSIIIIYNVDMWDLIIYSYSWLVWLYIWIIISLFFFYQKYYKTHLQQEKIHYEKSVIKEFVSYSLLWLIWLWAWSILSQIDMQMVIYMLWTTSAWYYANYLTIIAIPFIIIGPIFWLLLPLFSELYSKGEELKIAKLKNIFIENILPIGLLFNAFFFIYAENLAYILYGEKFITSWYILQYSILFLIFNFLLKVNYYIFWGIWQLWIRVKITMIAIIFNIILNIIFINKIGVFGAALSTWLWWILIWVLSEIYLRKQYSLNLKILPLLKNITIIAAMSTISYYFASNLFDNQSRIYSLFLLGVIFLTWFCVFYLINYNQTKEFIREIKKIKKWHN